MEQENRIGTDGWLRHHMHKSQHGTFTNTYMHNEHTVNGTGEWNRRIG